MYYPEVQLQVVAMQNKDGYCLYIFLLDVHYESYESCHDYIQCCGAVQTANQRVGVARCKLQIRYAHKTYDLHHWPASCLPVPKLVTNLSL